MDHPEHAVAVLDAGDEYANGEQVVDIAELLVLRDVGLGLVVDAVEVFGAAGNLGVEIGAGQLPLEHLCHLTDVIFPLLALAGEKLGHRPVLIRLEVPE